MMKHIKLPKFAEARVWINEVPEYAMMKGGVSPILKKPASEEIAPQDGAIEWLVPLGPRSLYGLLGATVRPCETGFLVEIVNESPRRSASETIASRISDAPFVGLSLEYIAAVKRGIEAAINERKTLPVCRVTVCAAVVGEVGSCEAIFENLARILMNLLWMPQQPDDAQLSNLLVYQTPPRTPLSRG